MDGTVVGDDLDLAPELRDEIKRIVRPVAGIGHEGYRARELKPFRIDADLEVITDGPVFHPRFRIVGVYDAGEE